MEEAEYWVASETKGEGHLLRLLMDTAEGLRETATRCGDRQHRRTGGRDVEGERGTAGLSGKARESGGMGERRGVRSPEVVWEERGVQRRLLELLREVAEDQARRVSAWREALVVTAHALYLTPPLEGDTQEQHIQTGEPIQDRLCSEHINTALLSVQGDVKSIEDRLNNIGSTLDAAVTALSAEETLTSERRTEARTDPQENPLDQETIESQRPRSDPERLENTHNASESHDTPGFELGHPNIVCRTERVGDTADTSRPCGSPDVRGASVLNSGRPRSGLRGAGETLPPVDKEQQDTRAEKKRGDMEECLVGAGDQGTDIHEDTFPGTQVESERETTEGERRDGEGMEEKGREIESVTLGLTGRSANGQADIPNACYVTAPVGVAKAMTCEVADALSSLMVIGSEELVSRVIRVKVQDGVRCRFPVTLSVPFRARYRGNYRDVVVKVVDGERRASYISPSSAEGSYGGVRGSLAEVRVYALGLFAVVSRLKRESYTVPRRGLSIKLSMDPRVCLDYLPGSFTAPVVAQAMIQPVDATLLASLKSRADTYRSVLSTSPLLCLAHPSTQPLRRPLSLTLPCPPNPNKRRPRQGEEPAHHAARPATAVGPLDTPSLHRARPLSASAKTSRETPNNELLVLLGWREERWNVLDKISVRNLQNGLVSFELTENFERLLVLRLLSSVRPSHLTSLAEEVEASVRRTMVTVVLQRLRHDPQAALVAALPSRDLGWELSKLQAQAYCGPPEPSLEIPMCEGEQLLLSFSGNITSTGNQNNQNGGACERIIFHSQRKNRLFLRLTEVDPFGNYSSPHYKGTAIFHRVTRGHLEWRGDEAVPSNSRPLDDPVCKLSLTLPKKVRTICRPVSAKVKLCEETEPLSDPVLRWLSGELSEEDVALLVPCLRLRRSSVQLVRLQAPDSLPARAFNILGLWRRSLPAAPQPPKASRLARCLAKSGRPDLAKELLVRQATTGGRLED